MIILPSILLYFTICFIIHETIWAINYNFKQRKKTHKRDHFILWLLLPVAFLATFFHSPGFKDGVSKLIKELFLIKK